MELTKFVGVSKILTLVSCILFVLCAFGIAAVGGCGTLPLGLAFLAAGALVG